MARRSDRPVVSPASRAAESGRAVPPLKVSETSQDSLKLYLQDIAKYPPLTAEEELAMARRMRAGDRDALELFVKHNLRFVVFRARDMERFAPVEDLIQEGSIGLMRAAERFDPERGIRFVSYADYWITQAMRAHLASVRTTRIPVNRNTQLLKVRRAVRLLEEHLRRHPTIKDIALATSLPETTVAILQAADRQEMSLDDPAGPDDNTALGERLPHQGPGADSRVLSADREAAMRKLLSLLKPRDARVLSLWFGIGTDRPATLDEIGLILGVTRERVRQLRDRGLRQLRQRTTEAQRALLTEMLRPE